MFLDRHYEHADRASARVIPVAIRRSPSASIASIILMIHAGVLLFLAIAGPIYYYGGHPAGSLFRPACIVISALVLWWYWSWLAFSRRGGFDPYILFLTAAVLFNCGQPILEVFGLNEESLLRDHFSEKNSLATLYLVALGISALHLGVLLSTALSSSRCLEMAGKSSLSEVHLRNVYRVGLVLFLISAVPSILQLRDRLQIAMAEGYTRLYQQRPIGLAASVGILSDLLFPGAAFVIAGGRGRPVMRTLALLSILVWSALELFLGARAHALMPALGMVWLWDRTVRPISKTVLVGTALLMIGVVSPLVGVMRQGVGRDRLSLGGMQSAFSNIDNPFVAELSEMGFSANTIPWTMELVPSVRPFSLGGTYLSAVLTLLPNWTGTSPHPALRLFGYDIPEYWVTWEFDPEFASRGGSYGYSFIAEAYLNFGWAAPIAVFVLGAIYGRLMGWTLNGNDPAKMAIMGVFLSSVLLFARSSSMNVVRPLFWYALIPYFVITLLDSWCSSQRAHAFAQEVRTPFHKAAGFRDR